MFGNGPGMFIVLVIVAVVIAFIMKKVAVAIYRKTGVNTLSAIHKVLWYVQMVGLVFGIASLSGEYGNSSPLLLILTIVLGIALHLALSLKAGIANAVITGVLQGIGGGIIAVLNVFTFLLGLFTGRKAGIGGAFSIDESQIQVENVNAQMQAQYAQQQAAYEQAMQARNAAADAYAQRMGFRDADDAERAGINTGKYQQ